MLKKILNVTGAQKLSKEHQLEINGGRLSCNAHCSYSGQRCYSNGHCGCPGICVNFGGLQCAIY